MVLFSDVHTAGNVQTIFASREALWVEGQPKPAQCCHKTSINPWTRIHWLCFLTYPFEMMPCIIVAEWLRVQVNYGSFSVWTGEPCCTTHLGVGGVQTLFIAICKAGLCWKGWKFRALPPEWLTLYKYSLSHGTKMKICIFLTGMLTPSLGSSNSAKCNNSVQMTLQQSPQNSHFRVALKMKSEKGLFSLPIQYLFV